MRKKLNIGITLSIWELPFSVWSTGIRQNAIFLADTLMNAKKYNVYIINSGSVKIDDKLILDWDVNEYKTIMFDDIKDELDILIVLGSEINYKDSDYLKARGCKIVLNNCGSQYIFDLEDIIKGEGKGFVNLEAYDEIWTLPHHAITTYHYLEVLSKKRVRIAPFVWNPMFIDKIAETLNNKGKYRPSIKPKKIACFEPNINIIKYSMYPILITEKVYRKRPDLIEHLFVTNVFQLTSKEKFVNLMNKLDIVKDGIASFEGRHNMPRFLSEHTDVVVAHQWENGLNYTYFDVIYMNYPLIHNSPFIKDCGYYYDGFDAEEGATQLLHAIENHDKHIEEYNERSKKTLDRYLTTNQNNINIYDGFIKDLIKNN